MARFKVGYVDANNAVLRWSVGIQHPDMAFALFGEKRGETSGKQHRASDDGFSELGFGSPSELLEDRAPVHLRVALRPL